MTSPTSAARRDRNSGLDVLRGLAAAAVVLHHFGYWFHASWLSPSGYLAVYLFFVLSGYVIADAYDDRLEAMGVLEFARRRAFRFAPLYTAGLYIGALLAALNYITGGVAFSFNELLVALAAGLTFLPSPPTGFSQGVMSPLNEAAWTLILEFWINVAFALCHHRLHGRALVFTIIAAGAIVAVFGRGGMYVWELPQSFCTAGFCFLVGVAMRRNHAIIENIKAPLWSVFAATAVAFAIPHSRAYDAIFIFALAPLFVAIWSNTKFPERVADFCGIASFVVYFLHMPTIKLVASIAAASGVPALPAAAAAAMLLLVYSPRIDRGFDRPMREKLTSLVRPMERGAARAAG